VFILCETVSIYWRQPFPNEHGLHFRRDRRHRCGNCDGLQPHHLERAGAVLFLHSLIPPIAYIPLVILWFGIGEFSKIVLIFLASFLYVALNTAAGVRAVPQDLIRVARTLGASNFRLFYAVILPEALPYVILGLKVALALSWAVVVAAELVAAQAGLGFLIMDAGTFFRIPDLYVGILLIGLIGLLLERGLTLFERRFVHWSGK
jgi:ABC-type nitrate/sulfonate/bicarbonate transport system permease component